VVDIIPPFRNTLKNATIEPLNLPQEKLDELKAVSADPRSPELRKSIMLRQISGSCLVCGKLPSHIAKYRLFGVTVIEKYCDQCLARINA
jgi:hypothetical protein